MGGGGGVCLEPELAQEHRGDGCLLSPPDRKEEPRSPNPGSLQPARRTGAGGGRDGGVTSPTRPPGVFMLWLLWTKSHSVVHLPAPDGPGLRTRSVWLCSAEKMSRGLTSSAGIIVFSFVVGSRIRQTATLSPRQPPSLDSKGQARGDSERAAAAMAAGRTAPP